VVQIGGDPDYSYRYIAGAVPKQNNGVSGGVFHLERKEGGALHYFQPTINDDAGVLKDKIVSAVKENQTANALMTKRNFARKYNKVFNVSRQKITNAIDDLLESGELKINEKMNTKGRVCECLMVENHA
jgi:hypothetical protein